MLDGALGLVVGAAPAAAGRRQAGRRAVCHSAGEGWGSQRWTSRCAASAASTRSWSGSSRVSPNTDSRSGRSSASALAVEPGRAAGRLLGRLRHRQGRSRSRRHSSACQARSAARGAGGVDVLADPPAVDQPGRSRRTRRTDRPGAGRSTNAGRRGTAPPAAPRDGSTAAPPRLVAGLVDDPQQRPDRPLRLPRVRVGIRSPGQDGRRPAAGRAGSRPRRRSRAEPTTAGPATAPPRAWAR